MKQELLNDLIKNINLINTSYTYNHIKDCMNLLKITLPYFEQKQTEYSLQNQITCLSDKNIYINKIIKTIEPQLTEEQKNKFYNSIFKPYIIFTTNDNIKKEIISNRITNNKIIDPDKNINSFSIDLIISINDDQYKIDFYKQYESKLKNSQKARLISSLNNNENFKYKSISNFINDSECLSLIILSIKNDEIKLNLYNKYKNVLEDELEYSDIIASLNSDTLKLKYLEEHEYNVSKSSIKKIIYSLKEESSLINIWNKVDIACKEIIIFLLPTENKKMEYFKLLNDELSSMPTHKLSNKITEIVKLLSLENIKKIVFEYTNIELNKSNLQSLIQYINDEDFTLRALKEKGNKHIAHMIRAKKLLPTQVILNNLDIFLEKEEVENKEQVKEYITIMYKNNNDIIYTINWNLLTPKYVNTLGLDKLNLLGSFDEFSQALLSFNDKQYETFYKCLNYYIDKHQDNDWNYAANQMIQELYFNKIDNTDFTKYITDFNSVNINNLIYILLNGDNLGINSLNDINNYNEKLKKKCDKIIQEGTINEKKDAIFIKCFGLSDRQSLIRVAREQIKNGMGRIYNLYKTDINLIKDESLKDLFKFVELVINTESETELQEIYHKINKFSNIDTYKLESQLKNELLKLYNKELLQVSSLKQNAEGLYECDNNFSIIATSIGAYVKNSPNNYKEDWNRPSLASQHFCTNFIRNDMLGTAPIPHVMYGFSHMEPNSLLLSGATDIYSSGASFISKAYRNEMYYGPDSQINQTAFTKKFHYNEMDFKRVQNGKKKQPDYILVFKRNNIIKNIKEAKKASKQWDNLPIVVIDVDKCLLNEHNKIYALMNQFFDTPTIELYKKIETKILNNRITDAKFESSINLEELKRMIPTVSENLLTSGPSLK